MARVIENKTFQINGKKIKSFLTLCKLRVNSLIVFTAVIGMFLSTPEMVPWDILFSGVLGIGFVAGAAAATKPIPKMPDNKISHGTIPGVLKNIPITAVKTISELTLNLQRVRKFLIFSAFN